MSVKRGGTRRVPHPESPARPAEQTRRILALLAWGPARLRSPTAWWAVNVLALVGAALVVVSAIIHLHLWGQGYSAIAVIGPLFLAQGVKSGNTADNGTPAPLPRPCRGRSGTAAAAERPADRVGTERGGDHG